MTSEMIRRAKDALNVRAARFAKANGVEHLSLVDLWPYYTDGMRAKEGELDWRQWVISYYCYGGEGDFRNGYVQSSYYPTYAEYVPFERAEQIFNEQMAYMREHATIKVGVYEDAEGCSYNSIEWK